MPPVPGIVLGGAAVPTDSADTYPVTDPQWGLGGLRRVLTTTARNAIPIPRLERGMEVFVAADTTTYRLKETWSGGVPVDADWEVAIGPTGGISGAGNPNSVAFWSGVSTLGANIFFTRDPVTSVVVNNNGYTANYNTDTIRYIDPAGSNSNTGTSAGSSNAWQTPAYAVQQCQLLGPGRYIINCAAGTYTGVTFDTTNVVSRGSDGNVIESIIQFEGDQTTPGNVIFQNTISSILYHASPLTTLRLHGLRFEGGGSNTCIVQYSGKVVFRNVEADSYQTFYSMSGNSLVTIEADVDITNTSTGFSAVGGIINQYADVNLTPPSPLVTDPVLYSTFNTLLNFGVGVSAVLNPRSGFHIITSNGYLIDAIASTINFGSFNTFKAEETVALWRADKNTSIFTGTPNTFWVLSTDNYCEMYNGSVFNDHSGNTWLSNSLAPGGVLLGTGAIFSSDVVLQTGTPPVTFFHDYMYAYVQYPADPTYTSYALDNRYTQEYTFTCLGELPQGYTLADINASGITSNPEYLFVAPYNCEVVLMAVATGVPNGASHTDTYYLYANGSATGLSVSITNSDSGDNNTVTQLNDGDACSIRVTSDAATTAEDITVVVFIRRRA